MSELTVNINDLKIVGKMMPGFDEILTPEALEFVLKLQTLFGLRRVQLLAEREKRQAEIDGGKNARFFAPKPSTYAKAIGRLPRSRHDLAGPPRGNYRSS